MSSFETTLLEIMCARIMDIVTREGKVCLLSGDSNVVWAIPLICPACGQPWHFVSDDMEKTLAKLRKKLKGFELVRISYINSTSVGLVDETLETRYSTTSDLFQDLIDEVPTHVEVSIDFPAFCVTLERKRKRHDLEDIELVLHPTSILESVEIAGWQEIG